MSISKKDAAKDLRITKLELEQNIQYLDMRGRSDISELAQRIAMLEKELELKFRMLEQKLENLK